MNPVPNMNSDTASVPWPLDDVYYYNCRRLKLEGLYLQTVHLVRIRTRVRIWTKKWNSRELDSRGEEKASGQCGARRSQAEDRTPTQKLSALQNAHRKPDKVPCAFWDVRVVLRISHRCACMCVRACTRVDVSCRVRA